MDSFKCKLISDFVDYYDHWFDNEGVKFRRLTTSGMDREQMLNFLKSKSLIVPPYGIVKDMKNHALITDASFVVVYTDLTSHRGENKILLRYKEALDAYPNNLMSAYASSFKGVSWRYLNIGSKGFILRYESDDWRSNWNTNNIIIESEKKLNIFIDEPLYAIDFVKNTKNDGESVMVAIDFNIAPQIKGTGIEDILSPIDVCEQIKSKMKKR